MSVQKPHTSGNDNRPQIEAPCDHTSYLLGTEDSEPLLGYSADGGIDVDGNALTWSTADDAGGRYYRSDNWSESDPV